MSQIRLFRAKDTDQNPIKVMDILSYPFHKGQKLFTVHICTGEFVEHKLGPHGTAMVNTSQLVVRALSRREGLIKAQRVLEAAQMNLPKHKILCRYAH